MSIDISQFFLVFFEEAEELLAEMERLLLALDTDAPDMEQLAAIFRTAHSIKGGAATFGQTDMTEVTHVLESLLDRLRRGEMAISPAHVEAFFAAKDVLKMQLDGHRHGAEVDQEAVQSVRARLEALSCTTAACAAPQASAAPGTDSARRLRLALPPLKREDIDALAAELALMGSLTEEILPEGGAMLLLDTTESVDDVLAICSFIIDPSDVKIAEDDAQGYTAPDGSYGFFEPLPEPAPAIDDAPQVNAHAELPAVRAANAEKAASLESSSIRVSVEKVDQLINLVGELVITQAMIEQRCAALDPMQHERLLSGVSQLTRNTRDLQEAVMSIRMMPMDYVFSRFPRMVRDLAVKLGKKVDFITYGAATELDKGLIERIIDPLTHLVRNSVDHGIETPAVRAAAGKLETGKLSLSAAHQGGNIVIEVSDDGGGLNRERILAKARQNGLPVSDDMADADVWQLIFAPGFSTAEEVTDVSGRGVGMDVVKRNITAMGGAVDIRSARGFGTTISISLPLTLAILDGMSVRVGDEIYILPLGYVVESLQPARQDVKDIAGQGRVVKVRGEYLPLIALHALFGIDARCTDPAEGILVILESEGTRAALLLDELVGQQQVVVKNLESNYRKVAGISGATILGDGGVSLILDVAMLLRGYGKRQAMEQADFA
ncbi:chemotaxis protein CheA [Noviherbaspirillum soli]|uniref:chemotaxis protein CheA n=1 Tax=Noviherbaspirillum soli TaxID=1064518 RepID=UPI00188A3129|nr:chemotaxis protein CheA [Noviherbaspirillum soli]